MKLLLFGLVFLVLTGTEVAECTDTNTPEPGDRIRTVIGEPVTNGFVFYDGRYIPPPYVVSNDNCRVYINGKWGKRFEAWPPIVYSFDKKPEIPEGIDENSSIDDFGGQELFEHGYDWLVFNYFLLNYPPKEALRRFKEEIRSWPFVADVKTDENDPATFEITEKSGGKYQIITGDIGHLRGRKPVPPSKKTVEGRVLWNRKDLENHLKAGDVLFLLPGNKKTFATWLTMKRSEIKEQLPVLLHIATSPITLEAKGWRAEKLKIMNIYHGGYDDFLSSFHDIPPELQKRLAKFGDPAKLTAQREARIEKERREQAEQRKRAAIARREYEERMRRERENFHKTHPAVLIGPKHPIRKPVHSSTR